MNYRVKKDRVKKVSWLEDIVHLAVNTGIVYLGLAGVYAYKAQRNFFEELGDGEVVFPTLIFAGFMAGWKTGRRIYDYLQYRKEQNKNRREK